MKLEIASWKRQLTRHGHQWVEDLQQADIIVINTCAVTGEASKKSRQKIRKMSRINPTAGMVVTGCYATLEPEKMAEELKVNLVVPNKNKDQLISTISKHLTYHFIHLWLWTRSLNQPSPKHERVRLSKCRMDATIDVLFALYPKHEAQNVALESKISVKKSIIFSTWISRSCAHRCASGGYGRDIGSSLTGLIQIILQKTDIPRIRIGSLEPWELDSAFFELFHNPRVCPHLHLPMQSGSNTVLKRMIRKYTVAEYKAWLHKHEQHHPKMHISTDLIVGFPGETEEEFSQTLQTLRDIQFGDMHLFRYSPRQGTAAARLPRHVPKIDRF